MLGNASSVLLTAANADTATYIFSGDMSQYTGGTFEIGAGSIVNQSLLATLQYSSSVPSPTAGVGTGVLGGTTTKLDLAYNADVDVNQTLNIPGGIALNAGGNQGLGDLSKNGETIYGSANVNVGFNPNNGANTTVAAATTGLAPLALNAQNTGAYLTNNLNHGFTLTIGQAGSNTNSSMALSGTNAGKVVTLGGSAKPSSTAKFSTATNRARPP